MTLPGDAVAPSRSAPAASVEADLDIRLAGVHKRYGDVVAVDGLDLDVRRGEFFSLLGPSGSGKTTTLRLIAGFEQPDSGVIELAGSDVTRAPSSTGRACCCSTSRSAPSTSSSARRCRSS